MVVWQPHDVYTEERQRNLENQQPLSPRLTIIFYGSLLLLSLGIWAGLFWGGNWLYRIIK